MSASPRISEADYSLLVEDPRPAKSGVFSFTRRKEIAYGTDQVKINPLSTVFRRTALIVKQLSTAAGLYFWMVERIGSGETTRFKIQDASQGLGTNEKTIDRWLAKMAELGFIKIQQRKYKGQQTYSEYTLEPINHIIGDDGKPLNRGTKLSPGPRDKTVPTKRYKKKQTVSPAVPSSLPTPNPSGSENAEAAPELRSSASADSVAWQGGDTAEITLDETKDTDHHTPAQSSSLREEVTSWCKSNITTLIDSGFAYRTSESVRNDIFRYYLDEMNSPHDAWDAFVNGVWLKLKIKLPTTEFIGGRKHRDLGPGWLFKFNKNGEPNFLTVIASARYGGINLPDHELLPIGAIVKSQHESRPLRILRHTSDGYLVCGARLTDPSECELNSYPANYFSTVLWSDPAGGSGSGAVVLASGGMYERLVTVEAIPTPTDLPTDSDDNEDDLLAQLLN
jgi:hypothetical protein